jgi:hypothetical protein
MHTKCHFHFQYLKPLHRQPICCIKYKPNYFLLPLALLNSRTMEYKWDCFRLVCPNLCWSIFKFLAITSGVAYQNMFNRPVGYQYQCQSNNLTYQIYSIIFWVIIVGYA